MDILTSRIFDLPGNSGLKLRDRICEQVSAAISRGALPPGFRMPSCRALAERLKVSRNTVFAAYARLVDLGLLEAKDRSGYVVRAAALPVVPAGSGAGAVEAEPVDFGPLPPSSLKRVDHPADWSDYPYPFIYNQTDPALFPIDAWRECSRQALKRSTLTEWTGEYIAGDSPHLLQQLRQRLLVYRGVLAGDDEIMVTLGAQNALAIMGLLFARNAGPIAVEDPGYPDARNAFTLTGNDVRDVAVDDGGLVPGKIPQGCKLVYATPSHQFPTSVSMTLARREDLVARAARDDFFVLEDDYEAEMHGGADALPTLRSLDRNGRVIYVGSLSKTLSPGLRIGFIVASRQIIREARAIRTMLLRHPPTILQETTALFLGLGYYDRHLRTLVRRHGERWRHMKAAIDSKLGAFSVKHSVGGTSFWLTGPEGFDATAFSASLRRDGVIIDAGETFHMARAPKNSFRLGFAYVPEERMERGVALIAEAAASHGVPAA
ncbi:MocR-like pyridoxine biosynthesis transcription factor PdxR [Rhodobium gokarnense]|uniref:GntR family transcriptional regulator/MocR family aminotransferase n=1 Tax=Rhodobium gokarnense TaxID=364296 RepID=A0ABT3H7H6_9HYPH|nr:PLP-dependent aminotransferase family protein [Rhodobium gokarnense]MCW2306352.1 GntR family transcriptional regulator/MocR family aminotransferase [Rhodobium gokarnense]